MDKEKGDPVEIIAGRISNLTKNVLPLRVVLSRAGGGGIYLFFRVSHIPFVFRKTQVIFFSPVHRSTASFLLAIFLPSFIYPQIGLVRLSSLSASRKRTLRLALV